MAKKKQKVQRLKKRELTKILYQYFEEQGDRAVHLKELFRYCEAKNHPAKILLIAVLEELLFADVIAEVGEGLFRSNIVLPEAQEGVFHRKRNGEHYVTLDEDKSEIRIAERHALQAYEGDKVKLIVFTDYGKKSNYGKVIEIVSRARENVVGTLQINHKHAFVLTERILSTDVYVPLEKVGTAQNGDKVLVKITDWGSCNQSPSGQVVDVLGQEGENDAEMHAILAEYGLPYQYPERVEAAAERLEATISQEERKQREDFTKVPTFTIDPRDAKDFDDALSIRPLSQGLWEIGVHIADVSHYVTEGSIIDREAEDRATSVYLVDRTIPMLPERLCNFICSLRPQEEKLAFSVIFDIDEQGEVKKTRIRKTVIYSDRRFTYEEAQHIIERNGEASPEDWTQGSEHPEIDGSFATPKGEWAAEILQLNRIAKQLRTQRFRQGAIGFDRPEVRFEIDDKGHPISTYIKVAKDANKLVEEFMLLANRTVAESIAIVPKGKQPKVLPYRVHDVPDPEKLERLSIFVAKFGYKVRTEGSKTEVSHSLNALLEKAKGQKEENMIEIIALRAMMKARYSIHNIGHYGLMFRHYTHFTSPIRRYPDLLVHRLLSKYAEGGRSVSATKYEHLCEHCSEREQIAATAERASIKYKQTEFMADRIGQEYEGVISGVTEFGLYVEDLLTKCEGMVPMRNMLSDFYEFDEENYRLVGRKTRRIYSLGDKVRYRVERCNLERRQIDFSLIEEDGAAYSAVSVVKSARIKKNVNQGKFRSSVPMPSKKVKTRKAQQKRSKRK